ncbi:hypothetical protein [Ralstonia holmesii]|uniref:hypothetical protein n=1 Tax=Ralstonia holmesii TaxID=3058602 RepID=UPI0028F55C8A|nr:hypothetical protein [Ralstonia sp. LMG 32967]CAJ0703560.1 hypothetical protein R11007_04106 [Ralstonia sp. LMG 32967]
MTIDELHTFLSSTFDLVTDPVERGGALTYFLGNVVWHPGATTRILRVGCGVDNHVSHIKLCVSSDNNNSVFVPLPVTWPELEQIVANEISLHARGRLVST